MSCRQYRSSQIKSPCNFCDRPQLQKNLPRHLKEVHHVKDEDLDKHMIPKTQKTLDFSLFSPEKPKGNN